MSTVKSHTARGLADLRALLGEPAEREDAEMIQNGIRELFAAEASEDLLGPSMVDIDAVVRRERRAMVRRRALVGAGAVAATTALIVVAPVALAGLAGGKAGNAPPGASAEPSAPATTATLDPRIKEKVDLAAQVLEDHFGIVARPEYPVYPAVDILATAEGTHRGTPVSTWVAVGRYLQLPDPWPQQNPCTGQGSSSDYSDVTCAGFPRPDGSVVWLHSAWTGTGTEQRYFTEVTQFRADRTWINLMVIYRTVKHAFTKYPDSVIVAASADLRLADHGVPHGPDPRRPSPTPSG